MKPKPQVSEKINLELSRREPPFLSLDKDRIVAQFVFEREHTPAIKSLIDEKLFRRHFTLFV